MVGAGHFGWGGVMLYAYSLVIYICFLGGNIMVCPTCPHPQRSAPHPCLHPQQCGLWSECSSFCA